MTIFQGSGGQIIKAWADFNGSSENIRASYNVSSISDNGNAQYTANFTTSMSGANYCALGSSIGSHQGGYHSTVTADAALKQAGSCRFKMRHMNDQSYELYSVNIAVID